MHWALAQRCLRWRTSRSGPLGEIYGGYLTTGIYEISEHACIAVHIDGAAFFFPAAGRRETLAFIYIEILSRCI